MRRFGECLMLLAIVASAGFLGASLAFSYCTNEIRSIRLSSPAHYTVTSDLPSRGIETDAAMSRLIDIQERIIRLQWRKIDYLESQLERKPLEAPPPSHQPLDYPFTMWRHVPIVG